MEALKKILKRVFPTPFLKDAFLLYNKVRIRTVDKLLFPEWKIAASDFLIYRNGYPFRENNVNIEELSPGAVKDFMRYWFNWTQEEYILILDKPCIIEPDYGWAIVNGNRLVYYSLGVSRTWFQPKPRLIKMLTSKKDQHLPKAISLRDTGEENYFHFYNDVLAKLYFLMSYNLDVANIPVIVSKKLWDKKYFQYYHSKSSLLQSIQWIVQADNYISCDSLILCKPLTHRPDLWKALLSPITIESNGAHERIFVTRSKSRLRFIENIEDIEAVCKDAGFRIMDMDDLSSAKQIEVFSSARYVVGIHGAGLTNIAFCEMGSHVLEIFPPPTEGYLPFHYIMLAKMKGLKYRALIGSQGSERYSGSFRVELRIFERELALLSEGNQKI